jgi:hypothetical protein
MDGSSRARRAILVALLAWLVTGGVAHAYEVAYWHGTIDATYFSHRIDPGDPSFGWLDPAEEVTTTLTAHIVLDTPTGQRAFTSGHGSGTLVSATVYDYGVPPHPCVLPPGFQSTSTTSEVGSGNSSGLTYDITTPVGDGPGGLFWIIPTQNSVVSFPTVVTSTLCGGSVEDSSGSVRVPVFVPGGYSDTELDDTIQHDDTIVDPVTGFSSREKSTVIVHLKLTTECNNGKDDDGDGTVDWPDDAGCDSARDEFELSSPARLDVLKTGAGRVVSAPGGIDCGATCTTTYERSPKTLVTLTPQPEPRGRFVRWEGACGGTGPCVVAMTEDRQVTGVFADAECSDGANNDLDSLTDYPFDPGCASADDPSELNAEVQCDNGLDDDHDGVIDDVDPGCDGPSDTVEDGICDNGLDDDHDRLADTADPGCAGRTDSSELNPAVECDNGIDDDVDVGIDVGGGGVRPLGDADCASPTDTRERADEYPLTMLVDGPGSLTGRDGVDCIDVCQVMVRAGAQIAVAAREHAPDGFLGFEQCPGTVSVALCAFTMSGPLTVRARFDPVGGYAPLVIFHSGESHWPASPATFLARSRLMWSAGADGTQRRCPSHEDRFEVRKAVSAIALKRGDIKVPFRRQTRLAHSQGLTLWSRCKNQATYNGKNLTAPAAWKDHKPDAPYTHTPPGKAGLYMDVADSYRNGVVPADDAYSNAPTLYYEYRPGDYVVYWFFHAFNNRMGDKHEGDWEHMVVHLNSTGDAIGVGYYQHYCDARQYDWADMLAADDLLDHTHPNVFIAVHGHGAWRTSGTQPGATCSDPRDGVFDRRNHGREWRPWNTGLADAADQPWYDLGVGWGREGGIGFGPVGPGKFKRNVVPAGWGSYPG